MISACLTVLFPKGCQTCSHMEKSSHMHTVQVVKYRNEVMPHYCSNTHEGFLHFPYSDYRCDGDDGHVCGVGIIAVPIIKVVIGLLGNVKHIPTSESSKKVFVFFFFNGSNVCIIDYKIV